MRGREWGVSCLRARESGNGEIQALPPRRQGREGWGEGRSQRGLQPRSPATDCQWGSLSTKRLGICSSSNFHPLLLDIQWKLCLETMPSAETEWEETLEWPKSAAWLPGELCRRCDVWRTTTVQAVCERPFFCRPALLCGCLLSFKWKITTLTHNHVMSESEEAAMTLEDLHNEDLHILWVHWKTEVIYSCCFT